MKTLRNLPSLNLSTHFAFLCLLLLFSQNWKKPQKHDSNIRIYVSPQLCCDSLIKITDVIFTVIDYTIKFHCK